MHQQFLNEGVIRYTCGKALRGGGAINARLGGGGGENSFRDFTILYDKAAATITVLQCRSAKIKSLPKQPPTPPTAHIYTNK